MRLLEKILVPIDVNTDSTEQINAAIMLANAYNSEVILTHVINDTELNDNIKEIVVKSVTKSLTEIKEVLLSNKVKVLGPEIVFGKTVTTIVQKANSDKVNLILIGAKEKTKRAEFELGVIAEQIIRESDVPVWLATGEKKVSISNILCPVDFSEPSKRAIPNAILLAKKFNAKLKIINVSEPLEYVSERLNVDLDEENSIRLKRAEDEMNAFIKAFDMEGIDHEIEIRCGKTSEEILNTIKKQHIDLLIMGTNGRTGLSRFFMGSVTEKVIRQKPCSFITIKK